MSTCLNGGELPVAEEAGVELADLFLQVPEHIGIGDSIMPY